MRGVFCDVRGLVVAISLGVAACSATPTSAPPSTSTTSPDGSAAALATGLATFNDEGLIFDYPASWRMFRYEDVSSFTTLLAYLGTVDVQAPCTTTSFPDHSSTVCQDRFRLVPNSLVVTVQAEAFPTFAPLEIPAGASQIMVGGLPGFQSVLPPGDETGVEVKTRTAIARPGSVGSYYTITAAIRGPDVGSMRRDIDLLVASVRFDPPLVLLDTSGDAAEKAAARALQVLRSNSPAWNCFVPIGVQQLVIATYPGRPALARPQLATCTSRIESTPLQLWRMTLTIELPESDPQAGHGGSFDTWLGADGEPIGQREAPVP